ncbi:hypothetical protein D3C71_1944250 [compost metagenome]
MADSTTPIIEFIALTTAPAIAPGSFVNVVTRVSYTSTNALMIWSAAVTAKSARSDQDTSAPPRASEIILAIARKVSETTADASTAPFFTLSQITAA